MLRKESEAVSGGNGPVHQEEEFGFGQPAPADVYREIKCLSKQQEKKLGKLQDDLTRLFEQLAARLKEDARQPRLATEADGPANTKTRERTEGAATAVQAMHDDSCTARTVQDGPKTSISFGVKAEPPLQGRRFGRGRRCGAQVVSPILGDALTNSRWWFSSHRQNLHSNGDHLHLATSSALLGRGDEFEEETFMDFNFIRLVRQQLLETACSLLRPESYRDNTNANYDVRSRRFSRSSPRMPVFGIVARVALW